LFAPARPACRRNKESNASRHADAEGIDVAFESLMAVSISPLAPGSDSPKIGHGAGTKSLCRYKVPRDA